MQADISLASDAPGDAIRAVRQVLAAAARPPEAGASSVLAHFEVDGDARWVHMQWLMETCVHQSVRIDKLAFRLAGDSESTRVDLPSSTDFTPPQIEEEVLAELVDPSADARVPVEERIPPRIEIDGPPFLRIRAYRLHAGDPDRASTRILVADELKMDVPTAAQMARIEPLVKLGTEQLRGPHRIAEIDAPAPRGRDVPFADVLAIIRILQRSGFDDIWFTGAPMPGR
ncbi:MAG: hypothetical protein QNJ98_09890 [Planctomycetota bacterium]|nr:hypothetical protein [Planctomycetota bacterium]